MVTLFTPKTLPSGQLTFDDIPPPKEMRLPGFFLPGTRPVWWNRSGLWQARLWLGHAHGGEISLGLHPTMKAAHEVWSVVIREYSRAVSRDTETPRAVIAWRVAREVWPKKAGPFGLLPKWVYSVGTGEAKKYAASVKLDHGLCHVEPCDSPETAFCRLWETVGPLLARPASARKTKPVTTPSRSLFDFTQTDAPLSPSGHRLGA